MCPVHLQLLLKSSQVHGYLKITASSFFFFLSKNHLLKIMGKLQTVSLSPCLWRTGRWGVPKGWAGKLSYEFIYWKSKQVFLWFAFLSELIEALENSEYFKEPGFLSPGEPSRVSFQIAQPHLSSSLKTLICNLSTSRGSGHIGSQST